MNSTLKCWGSRRSGQLGVGERANRTEAVVPEGMHGEVIDVWAGGNTTIARKADGSTWCAGNNNDGQCGANTREARELVFISNYKVGPIHRDRDRGRRIRRPSMVIVAFGAGVEMGREVSGSGDSRTRATTPLRVRLLKMFSK